MPGLGWMKTGMSVHQPCQQLWGLQCAGHTHPCCSGTSEHLFSVICPHACQLEVRMTMRLPTSLLQHICMQRPCTGSLHNLTSSICMP